MMPLWTTTTSARAIAVRVRVLLGRSPVRRPARVADAVGAVERLQTNGLFQVTELALGAADVERVPLVHDRNPGGIIPAIFELPQPVEDDRHDLFVSDVTDDATHILFALFLRFLFQSAALLSGTAKPA